MLPPPPPLSRCLFFSHSPRAPRPGLAWLAALCLPVILSESAAAAPPPKTAAAAPPAAAASAGPHLELHQSQVEALQSPGPDLRHSDAVFAWVFRHLPDEVTVLPTENYYYWKLTSQGREIRGNFRPASGLREKGILSFAYAEWLEYPDETLAANQLSIARRFTAAEGVTVTCPDPLTCDVSSEGKTVRFHLHAIPQTPPGPGILGEGEKFVSRTFDESGLPFFLCYQPASKSFFWILNEESPAAENFTPLAPDILLGRRTGFVFWTDPAHARRKILTAVRQASIARNDFFDGPFDQLADNYAAQVPLRAFVEDAFPALKNQIDLHGYFLTGPDAGNRVALTSYHFYTTPADALAFTRQAIATPDPIAAIAAANKNR